MSEVEGTAEVVTLPGEAPPAANEPPFAQVRNRDQWRQARRNREFGEAVRSGKPDRAEELLQEGADPDAILSESEYYDRNWTPLSIAIHNNDAELVSLLLEYNASPDGVSGHSGNDPSEFRQSPLHEAVRSDSIEIVKLLLSYHADQAALDSDRQTPLHSAIECDCRQMAEFLLSCDGWEINGHDSRGKTVLHSACARGWGEVVEKLLVKGASVHVRDKKGRTPLHDAAISNSVEVLDKLISVGSEVDARDGKQRTPIYKACARGEEEAVTRLLDAGASIHVQDAWGKTPLHLASASNRAKVVGILIAHGASVNAKLSDGSTPLHEALRHGAFQAAEIMLKHANIEISLMNNDNGNEIRFLEPSWHSLLHSPDAGLPSDLQDLEVEAPPEGSEKKSVCEGFEGAVWPWPAVPFVLATPSVQDLLYRKPSPLVKTPVGGNVTWIHVPANNRTWIEDVAKVLYSSNDPSTPSRERTGNFLGDGDESDGNSDYQSEVEELSSMRSKSSGTQESRPRKLRSILEFIRSEFGSDRTRSSRLEDWRDTMFVLAFPLIDIDLRDRYYDSGITHDMDSTGGSRVEANELRVVNGKLDERNGDAFIEKIKKYTVDGGQLPEKRDQTYDKLCKKLEHTYDNVDPPISLDQYFHESIDENDLNLRNGDQVISRFIARQRAKFEEKKERQEAGQQGRHPQNGAGPGKTPSQLEEGLAGSSNTPPGTSLTGELGFHQRIITTPKFWIWKLDANTIVTSFPQRWGEKGRQGPLTRAIWTRLMERFLRLQDGQQGKVSLGLEAMLDEIVQACLQFRPSFCLKGIEYGYPDAFASEIAFIVTSLFPLVARRLLSLSRKEPMLTSSTQSREATRLYKEYTKSLGRSVDDFSDSIKFATECLITVDDILNEMSMIRRVYRDQGRIMLSLKLRPEAKRDDAQSDSDQCYNTDEWGYEGMRSAQDKLIIARLKHLEKDAQMIRKSITTLLDLRQRQVTIDIAMSADEQANTLFRQSSILAIFTMATVLFAPLSWVASMMALKIDNFTPDTWSKDSILGASFGSVLGTLVFCGVGILLYVRQEERGTRKRTGKKRT